MSGFTPGPWFTVRHCGRDEWPAVSTNEVDSNSPLAEVFDGRGLHEKNDEQWANARLIASAPELLEALREYDKFFGGSYRNTGSAFGTMQEKARAAIRKATGAAE